MNRLIPNVLTVGALCAGLTAIRFALLGQWQAAVVAVIVAGIFDGLDGRAARLLGGTTQFGAEFDSLSDFLSFGVAPAILVYLWSLSQIGGVGWAIAVLYAVCCALRLARFNTAIGDPNPPPWAGNYFTGAPAPAAAGLAILPMMVSFEHGPGWFDGPAVNAVNMLVIAVLMISRVPTYSIKKLRIPPRYMLFTLVLFGLVMVALASEPWVTLIAVGAIYLFSIPISIWSQARAKRATPPAPPPSLPPSVDAGGDAAPVKDEGSAAR